MAGYGFFFSCLFFFSVSGRPRASFYISIAHIFRQRALILLISKRNSFIVPRASICRYWANRGLVLALGYKSFLLGFVCWMCGHDGEQGMRMWWQGPLQGSIPSLSLYCSWHLKFDHVWLISLASGLSSCLNTRVLGKSIFLCFSEWVCLFNCIASYKQAVFLVI